MNTSIRNAHIAIGVVTFAAATAVGAVPVEADTAPGNPDTAGYAGGTLDLSESWGTAAACVELTSATKCYGTEAELLAFHPELNTFVTSTKGRSGLGAMVLANCSSSLRLYDGGGYTGSVLYLTTRQVVLNLSSYGFDNVASSYRVGACATTFYSLSNAGGGWFSRAAYAQSTSMPAGFSNVVSSVYIS
jgi:hypothetical protein